jgi:hypothetical protein
VLALPRRDLLFILSTDWSAKGQSAVLSQVWPDGNERVVAYASRSNSAAEQNYASYKGEMCAAVWGVEYYQYWLTGRKFKLITDHQPLAYLMKSQKLTGLYFRWACRLSEFDPEIVYRPGSTNVADLPSRFPLPKTDEDWMEFKSDVDYFGAERPAVAFAHVMHTLAPQAGGAPEQLESFEPQLSAVAEFEVPPDVQSELQRQAYALDVQSREMYPDVFDDRPVMQLLKTGELPEGLERNERHRVRQRARVYSWSEAAGGQLYRLRRDGQRHLVPPAAVRAELVLQAHVTLGHAAMRRLVSALSKQYWWHDMWSMAVDVCRSCLACQQANTTFTARNPELHSLPMVAGFHRVHVDLAGPFEESYDKCKYAMIMVDSFTKWVAFVGIKDKSSASTMAALRDHWVTLFGAPAVIVADNGKEWLGVYQDFCQESGI